MMREIFHGWRRKAGVVTLLIACAVFGLWMRSIYTGDIVSLPIGQSRFVSLCSSNQCVVWGRHRLLGFDEVYFRYYSTFRPKDWPNSTTDLVWHWRCGDFGSARYKYDEIEYVIFPHWSVVLPLTVLSAYLILWRPQKGVPPGRDLDRRHGLAEDSKIVAPNTLFDGRGQ
jgi:hypothetical protein